MVDGGGIHIFRFSLGESSEMNCCLQSYETNSTGNFLNILHQSHNPTHKRFLRNVQTDDCECLEHVMHR